jgi:peptide/nickel transport system substrate-binding protein
MDVQRSDKKVGFANWAIYLKNRNDWTLNTELPVVTPWRVVSGVNTQVLALERNPFSVWTDSAGNQLPYIDHIRHEYASGSDAVNFMACAGELDFQERHLQISKLPFLLNNRKRSGYNVYLDPADGTDLEIRINLSYDIDPQIGALLGNVAFRRALSLSIDRDAINEVFMLGTGSPSATVPAPRSKYFPGAEWVRRWATLDLSRANELLELDGLGLSTRDSEGYRLRPNSRDRVRLACATYWAHFDYPAVAEVIKEQWRAIGIDLEVQIIDANLWLQRCLAGSLQMSVGAIVSEDPLTIPENLLPFSLQGPAAMIGVNFVRWFQSGLIAGTRPPQEIIDIVELWRRGREAPPEERSRLSHEIIRRHADLVLSIGIISGGLAEYGVRIANARLGNVPRRLVNSVVVKTPTNALPMTFFYR